VGRVRFTRLAEADLLDVGLYTRRTWDQRQCDRYLRELEERCYQLANDPKRGRPCDEIRPGLRRIRVGKHVVFYREEPGDILVSRVLHERMLPESQAMEDEAENPD
jgi:toxin ParE1/3/4